jgi:hypothetical protein
MEKKKKERWILMLNGVEVCRASSIDNIAKEIGCSKQYIYKQIGETLIFTYKKNNYQIIDRLA